MGRNRRVLEQVINFNSYNAGIRGCSLTLTFVDRSDRRDLNAIRGRLYGPDWGAFPRLHDTASLRFGHEIVHPRLGR